MKRIYRIMETVLVVVLIVATAGCKKVSRSADAATAADPIVAVICIDGSKSYNYLDHAKKTVSNILSALPSGSKIYIRWISDDSAKDACSIVSLVLPEEANNNNPFDVKGKRQKDTVKAKDLKLRNQAISIVMKAVSPKSNRTDVFGALYATAERCKLTPDHSPLLIFLTDMEDTAGKEKAYNIVFNNATVKIMGFQTGDNDTALRDFWTRYLSEHGAISTDFLPLDEPFNIGGK
jgi:hypothetical protein